MWGKRDEKETRFPVYTFLATPLRKKRGNGNEKEENEKDKKLRGKGERGGRQSWGKIVSWR